MKGLTFLIAPLAACLAQKAVAQGKLDLVENCDDLTIDPASGILSGECQAGEDPALTYVDLNKCLGWGTEASPGHPHHTEPDKPFNALTPAENGNFTKYCHPCYFIPRDEEGQAAAQLMCSCSPTGSAFKTEYTFDLTGLVNITKSGCLECMGVTGACAPSVRLDPGEIDLGDLDGDDSDDVKDLVDWLKVRTKTKRQPCEEDVNHMPDRLLPPTWVNTTYHRCKEDHSLCCFQTRGAGCSTDFEGFQFIDSSRFLYRIHYDISNFDFKFDALGRVFQFCRSAGKCKHESMLDDPTGVPPCNLSYTDNPLKPYEKEVYEDSSEIISSQIKELTEDGAQGLEAEGRDLVDSCGTGI